MARAGSHVVVRDPVEERKAEGIAFGLYALDAPLGTSISRGWDRLDARQRELLMARARFVLAMAPDVPAPGD